MPRPSAWTRLFCPGQNINCPRLKVHFCLQKSFKRKFPNWKSLENSFSARNIHFEWFLKSKNQLSNPEQNFCPGPFQSCHGEKIFFPGRWARQGSLLFWKWTHFFMLFWIYHSKASHKHNCISCNYVFWSFLAA